MNQRFRVLRDLGEQFEHAAQAKAIDLAISPARATRPPKFQVRHPSRSRLTVIGFSTAAVAAFVLGLVLGSGSNRSSPGAAQAQEAAFVSQFPVLSLPQSAAARAQADSGPANTLNAEESAYPVLINPQSSTARSGATQGIAPTLNASPSFTGGSSGSLHYTVRFVGEAKYQNVPSLTREVTLHGIQVWFFVVYLPITNALPKAIVSGNEPHQARQYTSKRYLTQQRRAWNEFAGYQLYARVGSNRRPNLVYSGIRDRRDLTRTEQQRFLASRQISNATLPGPHGTIVAVVPGRVARLSWSWPTEFNSSALRFVPAVTLSATVTDDVAVAAAPARFNTAEQIDPEHVTYYDVADRVIGRYSDPGASARSYLRTTWDGSTPGPETSQSRRAESNPATPNRVVIEPTVTSLQAMNGNSAPQFYFNVLLNYRTYYLRLTGGPHAGCILETINGKLTDRSGALDDPSAEPTVRGDTFEDHLPFDAIHCAGTYKLSVSVARANGNPYPPFGSATFTVKH